MYTTWLCLLGVSQLTSKDLFDEHVHLHWLISTHVAEMWQIHRSSWQFENRAIINHKSKAAQNTMLTTFNPDTCCFCTSAVQMLNAKVFWVFVFLYHTFLNKLHDLRWVCFDQWKPSIFAAVSDVWDQRL